MRINFYGVIVNQKLSKKEYIENYGLQIDFDSFKFQPKKMGQALYNRFVDDIECIFHLFDIKNRNNFDEKEIPIITDSLI